MSLTWSLPCHCHVIAMSLPWYFPGHYHVIAMVFIPGHCLVIAMSLPCQFHVIAMSVPCHCHVIAMSLPCDCHVSAVSLPCRCHVIAATLSLRASTLSASKSYPWVGSIYSSMACRRFAKSPRRQSYQWWSCLTTVTTCSTQQWHAISLRSRGMQITRTAIGGSSFRFHP